LKNPRPGSISDQFEQETQEFYGFFYETANPERKLAGHGGTVAGQWRDSGGTVAGH
jgi:hypothetical protein